MSKIDKTKLIRFRILLFNPTLYNSFLISLAAVKNLNQRNYIVRTSEKRNQSDHVIKRWQCHIHKINIGGFILTKIDLQDVAFVTRIT